MTTIVAKINREGGPARLNREKKYENFEEGSKWLSPPSILEIY